MPESQETQGRSPRREDPLEEGMAAPSSILAWGNPGTEEPGGLQPMGSQSFGHELATEHARGVEMADLFFIWPKRGCLDLFDLFI